MFNLSPPWRHNPFSFHPDRPSCTAYCDSSDDPDPGVNRDKTRRRESKSKSRDRDQTKQKKKKKTLRLLPRVSPRGERLIIHPPGRADICCDTSDSPAPCLRAYQTSYLTYGDHFCDGFRSIRYLLRTYIQRATLLPALLAADRAWNLDLTQRGLFVSDYQISFSRHGPILGASSATCCCC